MASVWREAPGNEPKDGAGLRHRQTMFMVEEDWLSWRDAGAARMLSGVSARSNNNALPNSVFLWFLLTFILLVCFTTVLRLSTTGLAGRIGGIVLAA
eukprot:CAMPEP_0113681176 /NCGR_PEP_ID=MMETSP0038_2-20120614/11817_1 /TAXON_ID=2898 /ORGANISM="Cryptomonas paramecium" /LENGTH=96 /DNA_ID=CAMNT_0000599815 /DNA_START=1362 /DNA_END=1648 /DNA_ORIENTATION=- /assembly_acc=CAM_ASM_000170